MIKVHVCCVVVVVSQSLEAAHASPIQAYEVKPWQNNIDDRSSSLSGSITSWRLFSIPGVTMPHLELCSGIVVFLRPPC